MHRQEPTRTHSKGLLTSQMYTHSKMDSKQQSAQKTIGRKQSINASNNVLNIDKLVQDVKITHIKQNKYSEHIVTIMKQLESLKSIPHVKDEIITIQLLLDTINKKVNSGSTSYSRERKMQSSVKKSIVRETSLKQENTPIRDIDDTSCIVYTKFSLKDMSNISHQTSVATFDASLALQTPKKLSAEDEYSNREMDKLNNQILLLEKLLKNKGLQSAVQQKVLTKTDQNRQSITTSSSKLSKYKNFQNQSNTLRKNLIQKCKWNNSKQNTTESSKLKSMQPKFR